MWFGLLTLNPRSKWYIANLQQLPDAYPNCQLEDNILLEIAKATTSMSLKIERLEDCMERFPRRDAVPEALFRIGQAYREAGQSGDSRSAFGKLIIQYPDSVWSERARRFDYVAGADPAGSKG